ncbi:MAG: 30S ribosomal protein S5 [Puniceicoccales bacterium]|jgi:small subunit ribosomal protein S5|nr:30S ribosomal protein S5 [Puniceicoccales bacterium]
MNSKAKKSFQNRGQQQPANVNADSIANNLAEKVVHIGRCSKVVSGGRRFSFSALVVVGDKNGSVGVGYGRAHEVPEAVRKATEYAKSNMRRFALEDATIPHEIIGNADGGCVLLKPAAPGTGLIAGGGIRAVLELVGVKNVLSKSMRSNNALATVRATINALGRLRSVEEVFKGRGKNFIRRGVV